MENVTISDITTTEMTVRWAEAEGNFDYYIVQCEPLDVEYYWSSDEIIGIVTNDTEVVCDELMPGTMHSVVVITYVANDNEAESDPVNGTTSMHYSLTFLVS